MEVKKKNFIKRFDDLEVFKVSYNISLEIHKVSRSFPKEELFGLTNQIRRASKSICANLAEGFAKQAKSKMEFNRFITICIGSCSEMYVWLKYCKDLQYIKEKDYEYFINNYRKIYGMLVNLRDKK